MRGRVRLDGVGRARASRSNLENHGQLVGHGDIRGDGDSLWIRPDGWTGKPKRIRLAEVDAPEICQRMGPQAKAQLSARVHQRRVFVQVHAHDGYGRAVATVTQDAQDLGQWLAQNGWAWSPEFRRAPGRYAQEMARAKQARIGVFADAAPQLPANFRRANGSCKI